MKLKISTYSHISPSHIQVDGKDVLATIPRSSFDEDTLAIYKSLGIDYPKFYKMDAPSKLGFLASELVLKSLDLKQYYKSEDIGVVLYGASGSLDTDQKFQATIAQPTDFFPSPAIFVYTLPNIVLGEICIRNKFKGENYSFAMEAPDSVEIYSFIQNIFEQEQVMACLCTWTEFQNRDQYRSIMLVIEKEECLQKRDMNEKFSNFEEETLKQIFYKDL